MLENSKTSEPINVMLADANALILAAMSEVFERDSRFSLVSTSSSAEGFLGVAIRLQVTIGIIDWSLPAIGGAKLIEIMREQETPPRIIVYGDDNMDLVRQSMSAGAAAFVARSAPIEELVDACVEVAAGKMVFPFMDVRELHNDPIQSLSKRERTMLEALATGKTNRELAKEFSLSINTVKFHLSNIFDKLAVRNRTQAIAYYYSSRLADERRAGIT